ncbi:MAG: hypothetical protein LBG81_01460, partial [Coriobacteriaceae bacterium]|nr:hypothetical protein [Coriobacteriaceae bacterium]
MKGARGIRPGLLGWGVLTAWGLEGMLMGPALGAGGFLHSGLVASGANIAAFGLVGFVSLLMKRRKQKEAHSGALTPWLVAFCALLMVSCS